MEPATLGAWGLVISALRTIGTWIGLRKKEPTSTAQLVDFVDKLVDHRVASEVDLGMRIRELETENAELGAQVEAGLARLTSGDEGLAEVAPQSERDRARRLAEEGEFEQAVDLLAAGAEESEAHALENHLAAGALAYLYDTTRARRHFERAIELAPDDPRGWNLLGHVLGRLGLLAEAQAAYERVLVLGKSMRELALIATAYGNLGSIHQTRGDLDAAEAMYEKALAINEELGRKEGMANQYGNLGLIHETRGDLAAAEAMHEKSLAINEELGIKEGMAGQYGNLGVIHQMRGDLDVAEAMHEKALAIDEELGHKKGMANQYGNLGLIHQMRGDLDAAGAMYEKVLAINEELGIKEGMARAHGNLGLVHQTRGDVAAAREHFANALDLFEAVGAEPQAEQVRRAIASLEDHD